MTAKCPKCGSVKVIDLNNLQTKDIFNVGNVFFVSASGRVYDDRMEKALLIRFEIMRSKFIQKNQQYPGYPMFLNSEQSDFLQKLRDGE